MCQSLRSKAATTIRRSASALSAWKLVGGGPGVAPGASLPPPSRISAGTSSSTITSVSVAMIMRSTTLRLRGQRRLADFVQKQRAARGCLERALAEHIGAGEGTALVPEQLVFDQALGERAAVEGDQRALRARAEAMHLLGDELLSRSTLAYDQHRARNLGDARDRVLEPLHGAAGAHQGGVGAGALAQGGDLSDEALSRERVLDLLHDPLHRFGLVDEALGAQPDRLGAAIVVARPGVDDHGSAEAAPLHRPQYLDRKS